jgi:outer membrane receptor for ferrienterochelin and colicins
MDKISQCVGFFFWGIACVLLSISFVFAQDQVPSLESGKEEQVLFQQIPSVFGASKYEQKITEAPSYVTIVTREEIKKYGYRNLADVLRSVPGFYVSYDRTYHYAGIRGFSQPGDYNSRLLTLVDGHRINDGIYDQGPIGNDFPVDIDLMERIEIIRGPSSSLYGTNALFGTINVITRKGRNLKGGEISGEIGSHETYKGRATYGNRFSNGLEFLLSGSFYDSQGADHYYKEFDDPSTNNGTASGVDDEQYGKTLLTASFRDFTFQAAYASRDKTIPTASWETVFNDPANFAKDKHGYLDVRYEKILPNDWGVLARLYYDQYRYSESYQYDLAAPGNPPDLLLTKDFSKAEWWGQELQISKSLFGKHKIILGGEFRDNFTLDQMNYDESPYSLHLDDRRDSYNWALFFQGDFKILDNLVFNGGLRYDDYSTFGGTTSPRLALIYDPLERTTLKLIFGEAFRAPNAYELYYTDGGTTMKSNPSLEPEKIKTYELILERYLGDHLRMVFSGFYYDINNLITQTIDPADNLLTFGNLSQVKAKGVDMELEGKWPNGIEGRISYSYQKAQDKVTNELLVNSPTHLAKLNLNIPLIQERLFAGFEMQYVADKKTLTGAEAEDYWITNLTLFSTRLVKGCEVSASVYNLFDKDYGHPGSSEHRQDTIQQDGRVVRLQVTYSF